MIDGVPVPGMPENGFTAVAGRIEAPDPPTLLLVVGTWDTISKAFSLRAQWHSDYRWGAGLQVLF